MWQHDKFSLSLFIWQGMALDNVQVLQTKVSDVMRPVWLVSLVLVLVKQDRIHGQSAVAAGGQGQWCEWAGAVYEWAGAVLTPGRSCDDQQSIFQSISRHQNFRVTYRQTYQGTHPLIESLMQRLKIRDDQLLIDSDPALPFFHRS